MFKKTKIVCTIGPASYAPEKILELIHCGMNVARINFSHGSHDFHREIIKNIREAEITSGVTIPIIQDLCGPKIRVGKLAKEPLKLLDNEECFITTSDKPEKEDYIPITYKNLNDEIASGDKILIEDGKKALEVLEVIGNVIHCKVLVGGEIYSGKGVNLPNSRLSTSSLTSKDIDDLLFGLQEGVDMIALSFVRKAGDVKAVKTIMEEKGFKKPIIAKIEKPEAVQNIDEIIEAFDMIMVARGDLGVEMPLEKIPLIQKEIIRKCNNLCKPVITATQMLESMMTNPTPTRAEVTDIANAILDGTDAVMLSGETAIGNYPELAVEMMAKTAVEIEKNIDHEGILRRAKTLYGFKIEDAVSLATCHTALNLDIKTIVTTTKSGSTARLVSRYRPKARIIAITPKLSTMRELGICWGVYPVLIDEIKNTDDMFEKVRNYINNSGITEDDKLVIIMAGLPFEIEGITNMMKVERIS